VPEDIIESVHQLKPSVLEAAHCKKSNCSAYAKGTPHLKHTARMQSRLRVS